MAKLTLVTVPSTSVEVEGFVAHGFEIEIGDKRTLFFVFKSDHVNEEMLRRFKLYLDETLATEEGAKLIAMSLPSSDSFEIHELGMNSSPLNGTTT